MANIFERAGQWMAQQIAGYMTTPRERVFRMVQDYYSGDHPAQLKVKPGQDDDNVTMNWIGLALDRAVSMLVSAGVEFQYPEEQQPFSEYIDAVWETNDKKILLHDAALDGGLFGTPFIKIIPDGIVNKYTGEVYPRLVLLDPKLMSIEVDPMDKSEVKQYVMQFKVTIDGKERLFKEVTRHSSPSDFQTDPQADAIDRDTWVVEMFEFINSWTLIDRVEFPYNFPPILHWKNLPSPHSVYGMSDIQQVLNIQDKFNFVASNNLKINRYHAHPKTWAAGVTKTDKSSWGADEMILISAADGKISNLEMSSDLTASRGIADDLRQGLFDISRQLDISSISDKVGQLTNFGLRLLYSDSIAKTKTKRELYGEAFMEINRRLLVIAKDVLAKCEVVFGDSIPVNEKEELDIDQQALDMGIVDKQTVAERWKKRYGQDWETLQQRMSEQKASESNVGSLLIQKFNKGQ